MVLVSQLLEYFFEEKPNNLIMREHTANFDESSILVPSSSSLLKEVDNFGSSMDV